MLLKTHVIYSCIGTIGISAKLNQNKNQAKYTYKYIYIHKIKTLAEFTRSDLYSFSLCWINWICLPTLWGNGHPSGYGF